MGKQTRILGTRFLFFWFRFLFSMKKEKKKEEREDKKRFIPRKILLFIPILPPLLTLLTSPKARATEFNSQVTNFLNEGIENGLKSE